jgi:hypothetical protein
MSSVAGWVHRLFADKPQNHQLVILVNRTMYLVRAIDEVSVTVSPILCLEVSENLYTWEFVELKDKMRINNYWYMPTGKNISFGALDERSEVET